MRIRRSTGLQLMAGLVLVGAVAGCGEPDPRFVHASQKREARIAGYLDRFAAREADGPRRLRIMEDRIARGAAEDTRQLQATWSYLEDNHQDDVRLWPQRRNRTKQVVRRELQGDVKNIDRTIPNLFY